MRESVADFIKKKFPKYARSELGTEGDPIRQAILEKRMPLYGTDIRDFRNYAIDAAQAGNPEALYDLTLAYDKGTGIKPFAVNTVDEEARWTAQREYLDALIDQEARRIAAEGGDPEIARKVLDRELIHATPKELQGSSSTLSREREMIAALGGNLDDPAAKQAIQNGEIFYGFEPTDFRKLALFAPREVADYLSSIPANRLSSMSFPEAMIEGAKRVKLSRDWEEVVRVAEKGKASTLPKETLLFGTRPLTKTAKDLEWVQITDPKAAQLEGAMMGHSVGGYAKEGSYNLGGKAALESGKANLFSLRNSKGLPEVTVEMEKTKEGQLRIKQIQGKYNSAPEEFKDQVFDLVNRTKSEFGMGNFGQRYDVDRGGNPLDEGVRIRWPEEFQAWSARQSAGKKTTDFIKDNS